MAKRNTRKTAENAPADLEKALTKLGGGCKIEHAVIKETSPFWQIDEKKTAKAKGSPRGTANREADVGVLQQKHRSFCLYSLRIGLWRGNLKTSTLTTEE